MLDQQEPLSIRQAVIEVKVMRIGNKQMTQAVFGQIPQEHIIAEDRGTLIGTPLGRINWHPPSRCEDYPQEHIHVVWQKEGKIRHAIECIPWDHPPAWPPTYAEYCNDLIRLQNEYVARLLLDGWKPNPNAKSGKFSLGSVDYTFRMSADINKVIEHLQSSVRRWDDVTSHYIESNPSLDDVFGYSPRETYREVLTAFAGEYEQDGHHHVTDAHIALLDKVEAQRSYKSQYEASYGKLEQLDQLYIAV